MALHPLIVIAVSLLAAANAAGQDSANEAAGDWPMYRGNLAGNGYSALTQIDISNVAELTEGWSYALTSDSADNSGSTRRPNSQVTPIVVDGIMYLPAVDRVVALDPVSGEEIWRHTVTEGVPSRRGVSFWPGDAQNPARIIFSAGQNLVALNADTGSVVTSFGNAGSVDLVIPYNSVPMVYDNVVVVGANTPRGAIGGIGNPRAYDARSGAKLWEFGSVPQPGNMGNDTWAGDSWQGRLGANAWPFYFTVDEQRGQLYLPLASPIPFAYGGDRAGTNFFANSLVAVDIYTGDYIWHFQTIHHDLWDHDPPAPPVLFNIPRAQGNVAALGVTTKSGYLYILNRETGQPIYGVEERPVPQSEVPGEQTYPSQPFPVITAPLARVSYDSADLVTAADTSAEHAAACAELVAGAGDIQNLGPFTPWVYRPPGGPEKTTLLFPGLAGGPNWGGASFNPETGLIFVFSYDLGSLGWLEDAADDGVLPYELRGPRPAGFDVPMEGSRWPCQKPPWGRLTAVDSTTAAVVWQKPVGITQGLPANKQNTGRPGRAGAITTASGLLFIAATDDSRIRALDVSSGEQLWVSQLPGRGNANPMTYRGNDGNQYLVVAATDSLVAYRLP